MECHSKVRTPECKLEYLDKFSRTKVPKHMWCKVHFVYMCQKVALQTVQLCGLLVPAQRAPVSCLIREFEGPSLEGVIAAGSLGGWCTPSIRMNASSSVKRQDTSGFKSCV